MNTTDFSFENMFVGIYDEKKCSHDHYTFIYIANDADIVNIVNNKSNPKQPVLQSSGFLPVSIFILFCSSHNFTNASRCSFLPS